MIADSSVVVDSAKKVVSRTASSEVGAQVPTGHVFKEKAHWLPYGTNAKKFDDIRMVKFSLKGQKHIQDFI